MAEKYDYLKSEFEVTDNEVDSRAMQRIKMYLDLLTLFVMRGRNELKIPKYHQMSHVVDYIHIYGSINLRAMRIQEAHTKYTTRMYAH